LEERDQNIKILSSGSNIVDSEEIKKRLEEEKEGIERESKKDFIITLSHHDF